MPRVREGLRETALPAALTDLQVRVAEPRWVDVDDPVGRLSVVSGAIHRILDKTATRYLLERVVPKESVPGEEELARTG